MSARGGFDARANEAGAPELTGAGGRTLHQDEAELVRRAKERSPQAWTDIYDTYCHPIFRYIRARVSDDATAEDLTSAVFVGALKGISSYHYRGLPLRAWLYRIARNIVVSHRRRLFVSGLTRPKDGLRIARSWASGFMSRGRESDSDVIDQVASTPSFGMDPSSVAERLDLSGALGKLTDAQREVVNLRFFAGLSTEEIAQVMSKDVAAIYSLQARAIVTLRRELL